MAEQHKPDQNRQHIALVNSYIALTKSIASDVKAAIAQYNVKQQYFEKELDLKPVTFYRRMNAIIPWKPEELIKLIKCLERLKKLNKD
jgi:hypothetical protein